MENNFISAEMIRGHIDTIILLSLKGGDRDSKEICLDIEQKSDNNYKVKQGTFYSAMQRLVKQAYIKEYRSSATDGIRRKYYTLTDEGRDFLDSSLKEWNRSKGIIDELIETPSEPIKKELPKKAMSDDFDEFKNLDIDIDNLEVKNDNSDYLSDIGQEVLDDLLSELKEEDETEKHSKIEDNIEENEENYEFDFDSSDDEIFEEVLKEEPKPVEVVEKKEEIKEEPKKETEPIKDDIDKNLNQKRDYKSILGKLFPKDKISEEKKNGEKKEEEFTQIKIDDISAEKSEKAKTEEEEVVSEKPDGDIDFGDLYAMANREGFKIKTSRSTNKKDSSGIFINKLRSHTALIFFAVFLVEFIILQFAFSSVLNWSLGVVFLIPSIVLLLPIVLTIIYAFDQKALKDDISPFKNAMEIALIISFQILIIILGVALFASIDLNNFKEVLNFLIIPIIFDLNIPIYIIIKYLLLDSDKYTKK